MIKIPKLKDANAIIKSYSWFRGCDFTTDPAEIDDSRSPDSLNMIADAAGFPQKRLGWRTLWQFSGKINGLHYAHFNGMSDPVILVHHANRVSFYDYKHNQRSLLTSNVADARSVSFFHGGYLYMLDGTSFYRFGYSSGTFTRQYVKNLAKQPLTGRGGHYEAEEVEGVTVYNWVPCTSNEEPNILSSIQFNMFAGDGVNKVFWLTERGATVTQVETLSSGTWTLVAATDYSVAEDTSVGKTKITFTNAPAASDEGAGIDNVRVKFSSTEHPANTDKIEKCTICTAFGYFNDNRIFVSGNPDAKNKDWACAVDDPTYWPLNQWTEVGSDHTAIMGYLHYGDALAIIKQDDNQDAEIYMRTAQVQSDGKVLFPVQQGVKGVGAISKDGFANLRDDPVFYARDGVFAVQGTDASQQRTVQNRSYFVDNKMRLEPDKDKAVSTVWNDMLLVAFPSGHCYVADARQHTAFNESWVYEWFYWTNIPARCFISFDGDLFFGTSDGTLCRFNNDMETSLKYTDGLTRNPTPEGSTERATWIGGDAINAKWETKMESLGTFSRFKTLMKRGNVCTIKEVSRGGVKVKVTTDKNTDAEIVETKISGGFWFEDIDFANIDFRGLSVPQIIPFNTKVKKFKMIQLSFENNEREETFGLYDVQLQYIVNNYIK
jgi:hypothetical protein